MHFITAVASLAALAMGVNATAAPGPFENLLQARIYTGLECKEPNGGELTLRGEDVGKCRAFQGTLPTKSLKVELNPGHCQLYVYTDAACKTGKKPVVEGRCRSSGGRKYRSYKLSCPDA
ncbi:hypothetical protein ACJ41O_003377 [Fusarium nematophilum]